MKSIKAFDVQGARSRFANMFSGFTAGQKTMLALAGIGVLVGAYFFTTASGSSNWAPLYGNLAASDAASMTQELASNNISYKLADGGSTVLVPKDKVYQARVDLSAKGLPSDGSPGFELIDKQGIITSEFRQRVDYQRALEGELAKTIRAIEGVEAATVHLVMPQDDLFKEDARKATASVLVRTAPGKRLSTAQARTVTHLVSSSVEGLDPLNVTVADSNGRVLQAGGGDGLGDAEDTDATKTFEDTLGTSIQQMLEQVSGGGKVVVRVKAELNFDRTSKLTEQFANPDAAAAVSESVSKEVFKGANGSDSASGVLAASDAAAPAAANGASDYAKEDSQKQFAIGKVTERVEAAPGAIQRLSVAVAMDSRVKASPAQIRSLVSAAAGLNPARGDTLVVSKLAFDRTAELAATAELDAMDKASKKFEQWNMIRTGILVAVVLIALFLAYRSAKKSSSVNRTPIALPSMTAADAAELNPGPSATLVLRDEPVIELDPADVERRHQAEQLGEIIDQQPDEVAQMLRGWLADRRVSK